MAEVLRKINILLIFFKIPEIVCREIRKGRIRLNIANIAQREGIYEDSPNILRKLLDEFPTSKIRIIAEKLHLDIDNLSKQDVILEILNDRKNTFPLLKRDEFILTLETIYDKYLEDNENLSQVSQIYNSDRSNIRKTLESIPLSIIRGAIENLYRERKLTSKIPKDLERIIDFIIKYNMKNLQDEMVKNYVENMKEKELDIDRYLKNLAESSTNIEEYLDKIELPNYYQIDYYLDKTFIRLYRRDVKDNLEPTISEYLLDRRDILTPIGIYKELTRNSDLYIKHEIEYQLNSFIREHRIELIEQLDKRLLDRIMLCIKGRRYIENDESYIYELFYRLCREDSDIAYRKCIQKEIDRIMCLIEEDEKLKNTERYYWNSEYSNIKERQWDKYWNDVEKKRNYDEDQFNSNKEQWTKYWKDMGGQFNEQYFKGNSSDEKTSVNDNKIYHENKELNDILCDLDKINKRYVFNKYSKEYEAKYTPIDKVLARKITLIIHPDKCSDIINARRNLAELRPKYYSYGKDLVNSLYVILERTLDLSQKYPKESICTEVFRMFNEIPTK